MKIDVPVDFILNVLISQLFFSAAQNIIEILRELVAKFLAWIYFHYHGHISNKFWQVYKDFLRPGIMAIMFIVFGICVSLGLSHYTKIKNENKLRETRETIKQDIKPENIITLLKNYIIYYETVGNI